MALASAMPTTERQAAGRLAVTGAEYTRADGLGIETTARRVSRRDPAGLAARKEHGAAEHLAQ